jgi:hypothetical protein
MRIVADRRAAALAAARGRRHNRRAALSLALTRKLRQYDHWRRKHPRADYLEFVPRTDDVSTLADLAARVNWYLADRTVPIYMEGSADVEVRPDDAPHMDPNLVYDPGWEQERPPGVRELVFYELGVEGSLRFLLGEHRCTLASASFSGAAESGWFDLQRTYGTVTGPTVEASSGRLLSRRRQKASAFVLGTGPSAKLVDPAEVDTDIRIVCNSAVRDRELLASLAPDVIAFSDPVFHCGPSRYAAQFRADLKAALELTGAVAVAGSHWINPVLANCRWLEESLAVVELDDETAWRWPTPSDLRVRTTSNVLSLLMLPTAFALADSVEIAGCDGRNPDESYFWQHNANTQYADELMESVFMSHPAFFRDRDYADYYAQHCAELEDLLAAAESDGKTARGVTPSYIPALRRRGAPSS